ncbi:MAG TPA: wax ester/triacylglycerol synthase family O-acyltransferase [Conexibacter sp.]|nr:wax ester/triacylglycerol synthase family O-acyltransferase [Conexibacter sp.]
MAQEHLDRLTAVDASFLHQEDADSHMHIGAVTIFEGPPPPFTAVAEHIRSRLHLVPRYRQKLAYPPFESGRPLWIDDASFNIEYHVRHSALPAPGTEQQLYRLAARIVSQQLDRSKPLWECWFVEGLEDDRFALIFKTHHALVDGVSGVDLATVLFDLSPTPQPPEPELWQPRPEPTNAELLAAGAAGFAKTAINVTERAIAAGTNPAAAIDAMRDVAEGMGEMVWAILNPAPETPLNVEIGPHRRYAVVRNRLDDFRYVKGVFGGTVNDVVLTVVSGALARWLRSRGVRTEGLELRALVPVSIRPRDQRHALGNQIVLMRGPLPVYIRDPVARLRFVKQQMAPPTILAQASRLQFSTRLFNLIVTNVPGPQFPIYMLGRQMQTFFPIAFLPKGHALAIAIMSYNGAIDFGLLGDYDALPDIDTIADGIEDGLAQLKAAARAREARSAGARAGGASPDGAAAASAPRRRRPATRPPRPARAPAAATATGAGSVSDGPQLLPSGPAARHEGPAASMRKRARRRPSSRNGGDAGT